MCSQLPTVKVGSGCERRTEEDLTPGGSTFIIPVQNLEPNITDTKEGFKKV